MSGKNINFDNKKIKKAAFIKTKKEIKLKTLIVSRKEPYRNKNLLKTFIGYSDNDIYRPLCIGFHK